MGAAEWKVGQRQGAAQLGQVKWQGFELRQCRGCEGGVTVRL